MTKRTALEIIDCFNQKSVRYWLIGGWAIDFLCSVEKLHKDIDFLVADNQQSLVDDALRSIRFEIIVNNGSWNDGNVFYVRGHDNALVDLAPIRNSNPPTLIGQYESIAFPQALLEIHLLKADGRSVRTLAPAMHIAIKHGIAAIFNGLREKDQEEIQLLERYGKGAHVN